MFCELVDEGDTAVDSFVAEGAAPSPTVTASPTASPVRPVVVQTDFADDGSAAGTLLAGAGLVTAGRRCRRAPQRWAPPCRRSSPLRSCRPADRPAPGRPSRRPGSSPSPSSVGVPRPPRPRPPRARRRPPRRRARRPSSAAPSPTTAPPAARDLETPDGDPVRVVVTSLAGKELVDAELIPAGLDDAGILAPPAGVAGWYDEKGWPRPGFPGASILAGHINTRETGPDTFAKLPEVRPGARVTVTYDSGDDVEFVVVRSKAVPKKETPRDDSIWDAGNPRPLLRLITCDPTTPVKGGHYVGNWVLWADAAPTTA